MSITELRHWEIRCDVPGCGARTESVQPTHPLSMDGWLPPRWTIERVGTTEVVRCPAHAAEGTE